MLNDELKKNPFQVPDNYFESLSLRMQENRLLNGELKSNPFQIPENYFELLPLRILNRLSGHERRGIFTVLRPRLALSGGFGIAAALIGISLFSYFGLYNNKSGDLNTNAHNVVYISGEQGRQATAYNRNAAINFSYKFADKKKIDKDAIMNYLAVENININDVISARY
jgi:hypothetical protein